MKKYEIRFINSGTVQTVECMKIQRDSLFVTFLGAAPKDEVIAMFRTDTVRSVKLAQTEESK